MSEPVVDVDLLVVDRKGSGVYAPLLKGKVSIEIKVKIISVTWLTPNSFHNQKLANELINDR